ncbi:beta-N-acetylhexosaminidase [Microlunatus panaciterrae]|uniref:beta-N-acetylhexosaminidase n=1 Tax=Microlunatus panaciterrae TaxID=400768 RepID=A0ABS2RKF5_9ACTN|nr:beta-N-acetylhexosaminidase [Microlunatus panaciterrae]MBM7799496.1 hexosaminidase [Microlunatus panaciterrae]
MPAGAPLNLVPQPSSVQLQQGSYALPKDLGIAATPEWAAIARRLLAPGTGLELPRSETGALAIVEDDTLPAEGYRLTVTADGVEIAAADDRGVNWAVQTLRQLLGPSVFRSAPSGGDLELPAVVIEDQPRFGWRGVMLDTARHFMPLQDLYAFIDQLAAHKYNVFHLHLTEDQGWRFESKKYPRLQEVGSHRAETRRPKDDRGDGTPHGGFYTQDQLRSLVSYADQRGITIVPELEFPGHVLGVLAAYPELSNDPSKTYAPATTFGIFDEVLNLSDDAVSFVFDLYEELLEIFPSRYVHVGGDECPRTEWLASPAAKALAEQRGLAGPDHLQQWFTGQLRDWLAARGRQLVGWDEINDEGHLEGAVTMAWRKAQYGVDAAAAGGEVVMSPSSHTYFDYYPSPEATEPYSIGGGITTEQAYALDPLNEIPAGSHPKILGTQCQIWTEYMPNMRRVQYMLFPRACAHSEVAWSKPDGRSWAEFSGRLAGHLERLDAAGVNYRPESGPHPWQQGGTGALQRPEAHLHG